MAVVGSSAGGAVAPPSVCALAWGLVGHFLYLLTYLIHLLLQLCMDYLDLATPLLESLQTGSKCRILTTQLYCCVIIL